MMMILTTTLFMLATTATVIAAQPFQWTDRVVVVRAATDSDPQLTRQRELLLDESDGLRERDMIAFAIVGKNTIAPIFGKAPSIEEAARLDKGKMAGRDAFSVVLLGKDGGVKRESEQPITAADLFALIDTMPMRRQEMRR